MAATAAGVGSATGVSSSLNNADGLVSSFGEAASVSSSANNAFAFGVSSAAAPSSIKFVFLGRSNGTSTAIAVNAGNGVGIITGSGNALGIGASFVPFSGVARGAASLRGSGVARRVYHCPETPFVSCSTLDPSVLGVMRLYADGRLVATRELKKSGEQWRLPSGFKAHFWQIEVEARVKVYSVQMATSAKELRNV